MGPHSGLISIRVKMESVCGNNDSRIHRDPPSFPFVRIEQTAEANAHPVDECNSSANDLKIALA